MSKETEQIVEESATRFIKTYLEHSQNRSDKISLKELYDQYCEYTVMFSGKKVFVILLGRHGYMVRTHSGNRMFVFGVKSNWI